MDIAAEVLADDTQRIGISYTGFCLTALPHKRLPDDQPWEKKGHRVTLLVEPGRLKHGGKIRLFRVPYGARARMILLYLQTQAIRTRSREVALRRSMRDWMERMGLAVGGETAHALREQAARMSACSLKFFWEDAGSDGFERGAIVRSGLRFHAEDSTQGSLWEDRVVLDETFYAALRDHPVPLLEAAIRQLRDRSMSLEIYVWLAWRCHQLGKPTRITWPAIHAQFGAGTRQFVSSSHALLKRSGQHLQHTQRPASTWAIRQSPYIQHSRRSPGSRDCRCHFTPHGGSPHNTRAPIVAGFVARLLTDGPPAYVLLADALGSCTPSFRQAYVV